MHRRKFPGAPALAAGSAQGAARFAAGTPGGIVAAIRKVLPVC